MEIKILKPEKITPDNSFALPTDLMRKYPNLFKGKKLEAVMDLLQQAYRAGLEIGRDETRFYRA